VNDPLRYNKGIIGLYVACLICLIGCSIVEYDFSLDWEVTTTGEIIEFPAWSLETELTTHEIKGEKYLLSENYAGSEVTRNRIVDQGMLALMWVGLCLVLTVATYAHRYFFFVVMGLFALFLNRLNLFEIGLFGIHNKMVLFIPFILLATPLVIFHEYRRATPLGVRLAIMLGCTAILFIGVQDKALFTDHILAHSLFGFALCGLLFLLFISEEILFAILYVTSSGKGAKNNHLHFIFLSLIYLGNLTLYYLNKSDLFGNDFFYFDPFVLLATSSLLAMWSLKYKAGMLSRIFDAHLLILLVVSFGIITFTFLSHHLIRGNDAIYQSFEYFILYFHLGFGLLFFFYIVGNFIDPIIKGLPVYKVVYKERNFPYASARLGGFVAVIAFYLYASQEPYNLLRSGYYNLMAEAAQTEGNPLLSHEYTLQASYLGYNTHLPNYILGWYELKKGADYPAKTYFYSATQRFPSPYAWVNYGNLDKDINPSKVQAIYEEALRKSSSGEMENNLGVIHLERKDYIRALGYFQSAKPSKKWNQAPMLNKWNALKKMEMIDTVAISKEYLKGNFGVKNNILTTQTDDRLVRFEPKGLREAKVLHRQAYLLSAAYLFTDDSLETIARYELEKSTDGTYNDRLRKALAIHLYKKGEVNEAFMMLDYLQANAHQYYRGSYLDAMGKMALHQDAYLLALDFFDKAIEVRYAPAIIGKMEALARLDRKEEIPAFLLKVLKKYPELTERANEVLNRMDSFLPKKFQERTLPALNSLSDSSLVSLGRLNAFHEELVIRVVNELRAREASGAYELLVDAMEINPYSIALLKAYAFFALDWNLVEYADQAVEKLSHLLPEAEFEAFEEAYNQQKKENEKERW